MSEVGFGGRARRAIVAPLVGALIFMVAACGGGAASTPTPAGGTQAPAATQAAATQAAATQAAPTQAGVGPVTDPSKLISSDEAAAVLAGAITKTAPAIIDVYAGPLNGFGFYLDSSTSLVVGIITPATVSTACAPAMPTCPTWDDIKAKQPGGATAIPGVGDDAFFAKQGPAIFLVGAKKGDTEVFLFAVGKVTDATLEAMKTLIATAIARV